MGTSAVLAQVATLGPYFAWEPVAGDGWRPLTDLDDVALVSARVRAARALLVERFGLAPADVPERVVASVVFLGMASRLVSPPLAAVALAEALPVARREELWWRPVESGPLPVAVSDVAAVETRGLSDDETAAVFGNAVVRRTVEPLLAVFQDRFRLSPHVLRGNVASALGGAVGMLGRARPDRVDRAGRVLRHVLELEPLAGSARLEHPWRLERNNCCLYYRIPGGGYCGDCVLRRNR